jgi:hypothetical protein
MTVKEHIIETCGKDAPPPELVEKVKQAIGMPPKAVLFTQLMNALPGENEDQICQVLDLLYREGLIDERNGWIHGVKRIDTSKWTKDDWDWIYGTGRFAQ